MEKDKINDFMLTAQEKVLIKILRNTTPKERARVYDLICEIAKEEK